MELLEREGALATLARARDTASRGTGRVTFVTGEPGIGKTSLVTHFLGELDEGTRALVGTCDDLAIPRPLGPIRDLAGRVSPALAEALSAGAAPHEIQSLLIGELERPPPTVLVTGLTNAEIADRLVVSARPAEHHVGAVLAKIGAATRRDVSRRAAELGLHLSEG